MADVNVNTTPDALVVTENQASITFDVNVNTNVDALVVTENASNVWYVRSGDIDTFLRTWPRTFGR